MKNLNQYITEKIKLSDDRFPHYTFFPKTKDELKELVERLIYERGNEADLNDINTSQITDMCKLFAKSKFNGNISEWDVSNVRDMALMFYHSKFNGDISNWNVGKVKKMEHMFEWSDFNGDLSRWDVSGVENMSSMFFCANFNNDISNWNINKICSTVDIFRDCPIEEEYKPNFNK